MVFTASQLKIPSDLKEKIAKADVINGQILYEGDPRLNEFTYTEAYPEREPVEVKALTEAYVQKIQEELKESIANPKDTSPTRFTIEPNIDVKGNKLDANGNIIQPTTNTKYLLIGLLAIGGTVWLVERNKKKKKNGRKGN